MNENNEQVIEREMVAEYTSKDAIRPDGSTKKWNWGAFSFSLWWGIANRVWLCFIVFVPLVNIVWPFIMAYNGNKWAYDKFKADGLGEVDKFNYAQKTWNSAGFWAFIVVAAVIVFYIILVAVFGIVIFSSSQNYSNSYNNY